jgi:hypothetical protein
VEISLKAHNPAQNEIVWHPDFQFFTPHNTRNGEAGITELLE